MKRLVGSRWIALCLALCLIAPTAVWAQAIPEAYTSKTKVASGYFATVSRLCVFDDFSQPGAAEKFERTWQQAKQILEAIERAASTSLEDSDVARFNALAFGETTEVGAYTVEMIEAARRMSRRTDGYFDPTVYPLVDLWGFSPRFTYSCERVQPYDRDWADGTPPPPDARYIKSFRRLVGMDGVVVEGDAQAGYRLRKATPPVTVDGVTHQAQIDLGGIAKGYACDLVTELLAEQGYEYGYFSCGSSSIRLMKSASAASKRAGDDSFWLEVRKPRETDTVGNAYALVRVRDASLSSSGDYGANYTLDGDRYCHIISPFTGYPMNAPSDGVQQGICTVTLLSGSATEDEGYTTALCLMSPEQAIAYANTHLTDRDLAMVFYRADQPFYEVVTNLPADRLTILDPAYRLASELDLDGSIRYTGSLIE